MAADTLSLTGTGPSRLRRILRSPLFRNRAAIIGLAILIPLLLMTFLPFVLAGDPNAQDLSLSLKPPTGELLLGADKLGRDVWARIVYGAAPTLLGAMVVVAISGVIGIPLGLVAGFYGGRIDTLIMRILDACSPSPPCCWPSWWSRPSAAGSRPW